jgi:hypothetical protein
MSPGSFKIQKVIMTGNHKVSNPYIKLKDLRSQKQLLTSKANYNML